jgi:hypothetical protein
VIFCLSQAKEGIFPSLERDTCEGEEKKQCTCKDEGTGRMCEAVIQPHVRGEAVVRTIARVRDIMSHM